MRRKYPNAVYFEIDKNIIKKRQDELFDQIIREQVQVDPYKIMYRYFPLEGTSKQKDKRIKEILEHGSDRDNPTIKPSIPYEQAIALSGIDNLDLFDCCTRKALFTFEHYGNTLLLYDEKLVRPVQGTAEFTFADIKKRSKSIIAVIGLI